VRIDDKQRDRRRQLVHAHMDAENRHDIDAIMATFAPHAINAMNGFVATDAATTRLLHEMGGFAATPGAISELKVVPLVEHITDNEIVFEGYLQGWHTGLVPGFPPPSFQKVETRYIAVYRFDEEDLLVSERTRIDFSPLYAARPVSSRSAP
jgi:hypothetical protein